MMKLQKSPFWADERGINFLETLVFLYQTTRCLMLEESYRVKEKICVGKIISSFKIRLAVNLPPLKHRGCMYLRSKVNATYLLVLAYKYFKTKPFQTYGP